MFQRILVPIDGSPTSSLGLREAIAMAQGQNATLILVHVVDELIVAQGFEGTVYAKAQPLDEFLAALRKQGKALLDKAEAQVQKHTIKCQTVLVGTVGRPVASMIIEQAKKCRADLIVMGTHGRRGIARLVMGSDAEGVVRATPVPILLVRSQSRSRTGKRHGSKS